MTPREEGIRSEMSDEPAGSNRSMDIKDYLEQILANQHILMESYQKIADDLEMIKERILLDYPSSNTSKKESADEQPRLPQVLPRYLPASTQAHFEKLEKYLSVDANFAVAVTHCTSVGGDNLYEFCKRISCILMTNDVACGLNLYGKVKKGTVTKRGIISSKYLLLMKECVRRSNAHRRATEKDVEKDVAKWLRRASERKSSGQS